MPLTHPLKLTALASALSLATLLSACGGGGGGATSPVAQASSPATPTVPGTQATPTYAQGSAQLAAFEQVNAWRQQCGFPPYLQNTLLDQSAQNHANYMVANGAQSTDTEVQGNPGFTGVTYQDRAAAVGWPSGIEIGGGSDFVTWATAPSAAAQGIAAAAWFSSGVYHQGLIALPLQDVGFGMTSTQYNGYQYLFTAMPIGNPSSIGTQTPLTFPCNGVTSVPPNGVGEVPTPPNTTGTSPYGGPSWGTPVTVMGNLTDTINLTAASITGPSGSVQVNILNASNDPNKEVQPYEAVAYPASPLSANTTYSVTLQGTVNGQPFTRSFSFTTGASQ